MRVLETSVPLFLFVICPVAMLLFIIRLIVAAFSTKTSEQMRKHPVIHTIWGCLAFVGFLGIVTPDFWPPLSVERRQQRETVAQRVQSAGGWTALQKDCDALADQYRDSQFIWYRFSHTNEALPPAIAALNPMEVHFYSAKALRDLGPESQSVAVNIKVFGMHRTGGHSTPYFGVEVFSDTNATSGFSQQSNGGGHGYERVTDHIYEVY